MAHPATNIQRTHRQKAVMDTNQLLMCDGIEYAYGDVLRANPSLFSSAIENIINKIVSFSCLQSMLATVEAGTEITSTNYPVLFREFCFCQERLRPQKTIHCVISPMIKDINAFCFTDKNDNEAYIVLGPRSLAELNIRELRFILGHEIGHILIGHLHYHMAMGAITRRELFTFPFGSWLSAELEDTYNNWCRDAEYTADRAGLLCCDHVNVFVSLVGKITDSEPKRVSLSLEENYSSHPLFLHRIKQLQAFQIVINQLKLYPYGI